MRHHEKIGLISKTTRSAAGYRLYPESLLPKIHFIKKAESLGFSLDEIADLLKFHDSCGKSMKVRNKVQSKLNDIQE